MKTRRCCSSRSKAPWVETKRRALTPIARLGLAALILLSGLATPVNTARSAPLATPTPRALKLSGVRPGGVFPVEYVEVPYNSSLNTFVWGITIEAWVKRNDASRSESVVCNGRLLSYCLSFAGTKLRFTTGNANFLDSPGDVPAGAWTHVAATFNGRFRTLYINGVLDITRSAGDLVAASNTPLGIGVDLVNDYDQNYFASLLDNVRVWAYARSAQQIRATMFQAFGGSEIGLLAEWRLDGNTLDSTGQHNGILHSAMFVEDGAIPHDLRAPLTNGALTVDGVCNTSTEYAIAPHVMVGLATAYVLHTSTDLWVCLDGLEAPTGGHDNWAAVYLDPDWSRDSNARSTDLSLEAHSDGSLRAREGDGLGNYTATNAATGQWTAYYRAFFNGFVTLRSAEFRIGSSLLGSQVFGLALGQQWITGAGDDRIWPALAWYNSPATWSALTLGGNGVPRTFTGRVVYQPRDPMTPASGIPGVGVNLIGYDPNGSESVVATAASAPSGAFTLSSDDDYTRHRLELDTPTLPRGYVPLTASSDFGTPFDGRTIDFGTAGTGTYVDNFYSLGDAWPAPPDTTVAPFFLIVASQPVISAGALTDFVDYKRRLGFQVEVASVEYAEQNFPGANRLQKIRNLEINRRNLYGSRFRYVMLVGWDATIPIGHVGAGYPHLILHCQDTANWPTDWFYADLVSNWDTNGNGCWGDVGDPNDQANHPTDDPTQAFHLTVAVGRIPFDDAPTVRQVLSDSMAFEQQAGDYKRQTLLAESLMALKGDNNRGWCWLPYHDPNGRYYNEGDTYLGKPVHCSDNLSTTGTDNSYLGHAMQQDWLNANNYGSVTFYENMPVSVGGSPYTSANMLTPGALATELNQVVHGFVHLGGHGDAAGVSRTYWIDRNGDGAAQASTRPTGNPPRGEGEIYQTELLKTSSLGATVTAPAARAGVYVVAACETGFNQVDDNFATQLLSQRVAVAWIGALSTAPYTQGWAQLGSGGMSDLTYNISRRILVDHARLGDAVWEANSAFVAVNKFGLYRDPRYQLFDLFGDPTLSYWGNPGGDSTYAPWPMMRQNAFGQGRTSLSGPGVPQQRWTYSALARVLDPIPPSPIVSNKSEVIVAHGNFVDVLLNSARYQRLTLNQPAYGTPALAADGTVYALDRAGLLYAFVPTPCVPQGQTICSILSLLIPPRTLRWSVDLGGAPLGSPIVGPNGFIYVPAEDGAGSAIAAVRPDGFLWRQFGLPNDQIVGNVVASGSRIYATTAGGALVRVTPDGVGCTNDCFVVVPGGVAFTTPPLLANGSLYAGRADGVLAKFNLDTFAQQASFTADDAVTTGPTLGPGGQVVVGTQAGTLYGLWPSLALRWQRSFGTSMRSVPAASANAVYIGSGDYLYALNPFSGAIEWLGNLGAGSKGGSAAIGYGREVYVQTGAGPIVAIGEGWSAPPAYVLATPAQESAVGGGSFKSIVVQWALPPAAGAAPAQIQAVPTALLLQRSADGQAWQDLAVLPLGTEVYTDTAISDGTRYSYRVQTLSADGRDSDFTTLLTSIRSLPALPAAPRVISATTQAADQIDVTWLGAAGSSDRSYRLERSLDPSGPYVTATLTSGGVNRVSDAGLLAGTTYYYRVIAINETGEGPASNVVSSATRQRCLDAPTNVFAVLLEHNHVQITWEGAPAGVAAVVEFNPQGSSAFRLLGTTSGAGPFEYQEINPNNYGYRVKFVQGDNESDYGVTQLRLIVPEQIVYRVSMPLIVR